jgi:hypothetical protein
MWNAAMNLYFQAQNISPDWLGLFQKKKSVARSWNLQLKLPQRYETTSLFLAGPEGTREFLREEFSEAFK